MAPKTYVSTHSSKRRSITITLVCVFALLLGVIGWIEFGNKPSPTHTEQAVNSVDIKRADFTDIKLVRDQDHWSMSAPFSIKANAQRIEPLLSLGLANLGGYDISDVDMDATGLNASNASITIGSRKFVLGNTDAQGDRRYAMVDNKVSFVPEWVWSLIHGGVTAFADLAVFNEPPSNIYVHTGDRTQQISNIAQWQSLQADKIVAWPEFGENSDGSAANRTSHILSSSNQNMPENQLAQVIESPEITYIITQPGYAYAISSQLWLNLVNP